MKFLVLIFRNMMRNPRRTVLTILTIAVATLVFAMLVSVPTSMDRIVDQLSKQQRLFVTNRAGPWNVPAKYCLDIKKLPHVTGCAADFDDFMLYRSDSDWIGISEADLELLDMSADLQGGNPEDLKRFKADRRSAAVGYETMKRFGWHVGQQVMLRNTWNGQAISLPFIIQTIVPDQTYPNLFLVRRDYMDEAYKAHGLKDLIGRASRLLVGVDNPDNMGQVARVIDETYRNSDTETRTETESDFISSNLASVGNIRAIIASLVFVVLITVLLISGNSMAMTVRDRIPEVALLRTLGFGRWRIGFLLFGEAVLLGLVGGAIGSIAALMMFLNGTDLGALTNGLALISVSPMVAIVSFVTAIAVSIVSGTIPVGGALHTPPAIALRKVV
ncbi:MAG TPA: ABC transporter permease [Candidatus Binataceae bacterium]|nr:ABC transporter permease [Candidatus Binataceae bacterium]